MRQALSSIVVLAGFLSLAACGGGESTTEPLTLDEYVTEFQRLAGEVDTRIDDLEFTSEPGTTPDYGDVYVQSAPYARDFVNGLDAMTPPTEIADEHDEVVDVFRDLAKAWEEGSDGGEDLELRFHEACTALEAALAEQGTEAELCADPDQL
jgi:hypothetical protein